MRISRSHLIINFQYNSTSIISKKLLEITNLGVIIDNKFDFNSHVNNILKGARKMLGLMKRNSNDFQSLKTIITPITIASKFNFLKFKYKISY